LPVFHPFGDMQRSPRPDKRLRALQQMAGNHLAAFNSDDSFVVTVSHVEMRRPVISVIHGNYETQETADFRHRETSRCLDINRAVALGDQETSGCTMKHAP
jgi:hypothetical protein